MSGLFTPKELAVIERYESLIEIKNRKRPGSRFEKGSIADSHSEELDLTISEIKESLPATYSYGSP